jgi:hypothetical protein
MKLPPVGVMDRVKCDAEQNAYNPGIHLKMTQLNIERFGFARKILGPVANQGNSGR